MRIIPLLLALLLLSCGGSAPLVVPDSTNPPPQLHQGRWGGYLNALGADLPPGQREGVEIDLRPSEARERAWVFHPGKQLELYQSHLSQSGTTVTFQLEPISQSQPASFTGEMVDENTVVGTLTDKNGTSSVELRYLGDLPVSAREQAREQIQASGAQGDIPVLVLADFEAMSVPPSGYQVSSVYAFVVGLGTQDNEGTWSVAWADGGLFAYPGLGDQSQISGGSSRFSTLLLEPDWITVDLFEQGDEGLTDYWAWFEIHADDFGNFAANNASTTSNIYDAIYTGGQKYTGAPVLFPLEGSLETVAPPNPPSCWNNPTYGCTNLGSAGVQIDGQTYVVSSPYVNLLETLGF